MKITSFYGHNVKGRSFGCELAPVTLYWGRNFAGKTARLEALQLALAGFLPGYPRRPGELLDALGGEDCNRIQVGVRMDDGTAYVREWARSKTGSVSVDEPDWKVPAAAVDPGEWLGLSSKERVRYLFARAKAVGTVKQALAEVEVAAEGDEAVVGVFKGIKRDNLQEWLEAACVAAKESRLACQQSARRLRATVAGITQVKDLPVPPGTKELEAARSAVETLAGRVVELTARVGVAELAVSKAKQAEADYAGLVDVTALAEAISDHENERPDYDRDSHFAAQKKFDGCVEAKEEAAKQHLKASNAHSDVEAKLRSARGGKRCQTCGHVSKKDDAKVTELEPKLAEATAKMASLADWLGKALAEEARTRKALALHVAAMAKHHKWLEDRAALTERKDEMSARAARASELSAMASTLPAAEADLKDAETKLVAAREALKEGRAKLAEREAAKAAAHRRAGEVAAQAKAAQQAEEAEKQVEAFKAVEAELYRAQKDAVAVAVGPLVETANRLCEGILPCWLAVMDGEFGMDYATDLFRPHSSFSGSEKRLAYCALCVALAAQASPRVAFVDEVSLLDTANQHALVRRLVDLCVAGELDNAVLTGTSHISLQLDAFKQEEVT